MKSILKWVLEIFAGVIIIALLFGCAPEEAQTQTSAGKEAAVSNDAPPFETTASEIAKAYADNAVAADEKYKNKAFVVTGSVADIKTDDHAVIILEDDADSLMGPHFTLADSEKNKAAELKKGQKVKLQCFGNGEIAKVAHSEDCELLLIDWS